MDYDFQVLELTNIFYNNYPVNKYKELLLKDKRSYNCLLIDLHYDYFICVPFRSEIRHNNAFKFKNSVRSKIHQSGLDYSKIIIVKNPDYIGNVSSTVDQDEYKEMIQNLDKIVDDVNKYIIKYVNHQTGLKVLSKKEFLRKYKYSSLKYFHSELGIF